MSLLHPTIRLGDTARFPIGRLGSDEPPYRHRFTVVAFEPNGCLVVRRLADGFTRSIAPTWWERYALDEPRQNPEYLRVRALRLPLPSLLTDRTASGYYVSAVKGKDYRFLLGPFACQQDACRWVPAARRHLNAHYSDPWCEIAVGTCKAPDGTHEGLFNVALGLGAA